MTSKHAWAALAAIGLASCGGITNADGTGVPRMGEGDSGSDAAAAASDLADALLHDAVPPPLDGVGDRGDARRMRDGSSIISSGTRFCRDARECFGLACEYGPTPAQGTCVLPCGSTDDCDENQICLRGRTFAASCFARCTSPFHCTVGLDCVDYEKTGERSCLPAQWVLDLPE